MPGRGRCSTSCQAWRSVRSATPPYASVTASVSAHKRSNVEIRKGQCLLAFSREQTQSCSLSGLVGGGAAIAGWRGSRCCSFERHQLVASLYRRFRGGARGFGAIGSGSVAAGGGHARGRFWRRNPTDGGCPRQSPTPLRGADDKPHDLFAAQRNLALDSHKRSFINFIEPCRHTRVN